MSIAWVAEQIRSATAGEGIQPPGLIRFNPNPAGNIKPGGAAEAVLANMSKYPGRWFTHAEILTRCPNHSRQAVSWALIHLCNQELIESSPDMDRNTRYLLYRVPVKQVKG